MLDDNGSPSQQATRAEKARLLYLQRRARNRHFEGCSDLFQEPGWDMLLQLYIGYEQETSLRSTSVCYAVGVALTTGLRWLATLERNGLVDIRPDEKDRRCKMISLTPKAVDMMTGYLGEL